MSPLLSPRIQQLAPSPTVVLDSKTKDLQARGVDVINMTVGEPDFPTPLHICNAAKNAIEKGYTHYTKVDGIDPLKEAIVQKYKEEQGLSYTPSQVVVSSGAKQVLYNLFQALISKGDEVIIPSPYWVSFPEQVKLAQGVPVFVETREEEGFKMTPADLEKAITRKSKLLLLNSPCNPTGSVYTTEELEQLVPIIEKHQLWVVSDEIYEKLRYDGKKTKSIASISEQMYQSTIIINGVSKAYAMTGWRIGYGVGPKEIIQGMVKLQGQSTSCPNSIAQYASLEALTGDQSPLLEMIRIFKERRNRIVEGLHRIEGISCAVPEGAFYVFLNVIGLFTRFQGSMEVSEFLLEKGKVATVPGIAFGREGYLRLSYALSMEQIELALLRIEQALSKGK